MLLISCVWSRAAKHVMLLDRWNGSKFFKSVPCSPVGMKDRVWNCVMTVLFITDAFFSPLQTRRLWNMFWSVTALNASSIVSMKDLGASSLPSISVLSFFPALCFFPCFFKAPTVISAPSSSTSFLSLHFVIPLTGFPVVCAVSTFRLSQRGSNTNE